MSTATKPIVLNETYSDKMDELKSALVTAINGVSLGNYVIVNINNYTWGSVSGAGVYPVGSPVTLRATPSEDCFFLAWRNADGAILSINPVYTFTPSGNTVIQADFHADEYIKIVSWANGTEVELNAMLDAHYRGVIDIRDYWQIGDEREVYLENNDPEHNTIPSQTVSFVITGSTKLDTITKADPDGEDLLFAVQTKRTLNSSTFQAFNAYVDLKSICDNISEMLPVYFAKLFKKFHLWSGSPEYTIACPTPGNVVSTDTCFELYETVANRIKYDSDNVAREWVLFNNGYARWITESGELGSSYGLYSAYLAPFGMI